MDKIRQLAKDKKILIAAHRGVAGGNIPCNTLQAYEIALRQGADIVEIDVSITADKQLYVFHPGMEPFHLREKRYIKDMTGEETSKLCFVNQDQTPTLYPVSTLDDVFELLKNRCIVNVDKFWTAIPEITAAIRRHGMEDQVIVKTPVKDEYFKATEEVASDLPFMPVVGENDDCTDRLLKMNINLLGAEVLFKTEDTHVATPEYIEKMHKAGLLLWVNPIVYNYKADLVAGHNDDRAMTESMDANWGWLIDRGFDILQTDWCLPMRLYLEETVRK